MIKARLLARAAETEPCLVKSLAWSDLREQEYQLTAAEVEQVYSLRRGCPYTLNLIERGITWTYSYFSMPLFLLACIVRTRIAEKLLGRGKLCPLRAFFPEFGTSFRSTQLQKVCSDMLSSTHRGARERARANSYFLPPSKIWASRHASTLEQ